MTGRWLKLTASAALIAGCALPSNQNSGQGALRMQTAGLGNNSSTASRQSEMSMKSAAAAAPAEAVRIAPDAVPYVSGDAPERLVFTPAPGTTVPVEAIPVFEVDPTWPKQLPPGWNWWRTLGDATPAGQGSDVLGIRTDKYNHVWVANRGRIAEFDTQGNLVQHWNAATPDNTGKRYGSIHGMFVDNDGFVWTTGRENNVVMKFTRDGKLAQIIGTYDSTASGIGKGSNDTMTMGRPAEIWLDTISKELFVADGYTNHRLVVWDGLTGRYLRHWGADGKVPCDGPARAAGAAAPAGAGSATAGAGRAGAGGGGAAGGGRAGAGAAGGGAGAGRAGGGGGGGGAAQQGPPGTNNGPVPATSNGCANLQYSTPHGIVGSRDGLVYISDRQNSRVQAFDHMGTFKGTVFTRNTTGGAFSVAISPDAQQNWLYVTDGTGHRIWVIRRSDMQLAGSFSGPGWERGQVGRPHNITTDSQGNIYVAEGDPSDIPQNSAGQRAQKFRMVSPGTP